MYQISICDDYASEREEVCDLVNAYFKQEHLEYTLYTHENAQGVKDEIANGKRIDIYILDVLMPETNGMELAKYIRRFDKQCTIIFITNYKEYAIQGYKVEALDYILKPVVRETFYATLSNIIRRIHKIGTLVIKVKNKTGYMELNTYHIQYVESNGHIVYFGMEDGTVKQVVASLEQYAPMLTKYKFFLRCHKSYIINLNFVKEKKSDCFILNSGKVINISRSNKATCKSKYHDHIFAKMKGEF